MWNFERNVVWLFKIHEVNFEELKEMPWLLKIHEVNFEEKWSESEWIVSSVISNTNHELTTDTATHKRAAIRILYNIVIEGFNGAVSPLLLFILSTSPKKEIHYCVVVLFIEHYANNISLLFISFCKIVQKDWTISVLHSILWTMLVFCTDNPKKNKNNLHCCYYSFITRK